MFWSGTGCFCSGSISSARLAEVLAVTVRRSLTEANTPPMAQLVKFHLEALTFSKSTRHGTDCKPVGRE